MDKVFDLAKNPLICLVCDDFFNEPKILQCFHTVCSRCLDPKLPANAIVCPVCSRTNNKAPLHDHLIEHLIESMNVENPVCSNCDRRDRGNMFFCNTCGQALCHNCRENTHKAKMFSKHDIKKLEKGQKCPQQQKCQHHGELFVLYSSSEKTFLCEQCYQEMSADRKSRCIEIDKAYHQAIKKIDFTQQLITELQNSIRDGVLNLKTSLDELKVNFESEKSAISTFCLGMQESIAKTHSSLMIDVQKQFENKEQQLRQQLLNLGEILPILFSHLTICSLFMSSSDKFSILKLYGDLIDRLIAVAQLSEPVKPLQSNNIHTRYRNDFAKCLEPWIYQEINYEKSSTKMPLKRESSKVSNTEIFKLHCQRFENDLKELNQELSNIKNQLNDVNRNITILHQAQSVPLVVRYETIGRECSLMDENLERQQQEFERLANVFETMWNEQLWRMRIEREMFTCQLSEILNLRNELKHVNIEVLKLEPLIRSLDNNKHQSLPEEKRQKFKTSNRLLLNNLLEKFLKPADPQSCANSKLKSKTAKKAASVVDINSKSKPSVPLRNSSLKPTTDSASKAAKIYPFSDGEDNLTFYKKKAIKKNSMDSLSTLSVNSSPPGDNKTLFLYINANNKPKKKNLRSWDTFPPQKQRTNRSSSVALIDKRTFNEQSLLYKTDSFEGHEEAVKTLVAAVQETRSKPKSKVILA